MIDLTGAALSNFLLPELRNVVIRHPRFRKNAGTVVYAFSSLTNHNDVNIKLANINAAGTRLSPDLFMGTQIGRSTVAKIEDKEGLFIEWAQEVDVDDKGLLQPGMYYLGVSAINEETGVVDLDLMKMDWKEYQQPHAATGSIIHVSTHFRADELVLTGIDPDSYRVGGRTITLLKYVADLDIAELGSGQALIAGVDYWVERDETIVIGTTTGGEQDLVVPANYSHVEFVDQDGYVLAHPADYTWVNDRVIRLTLITPSNLTISAVGTFKYDPKVVGFVDPENIIYAFDPNTPPVANQFLYRLMRGTFDYTNTVVVDGNVCLTELQEPGDKLYWEVRLQGPLTSAQVRKCTVSSTLIPGMLVAIGDQVIEGDQAVVIVFPSAGETYELYGSKENVTFDIEVQTNDLNTSSELASDIRTSLLVRLRDRFETAGLTIFEISKVYRGEQKDSSGTGTRHTVALSVQAAADWEFRKPTVTRIADIQYEGLHVINSFPGKPIILPRVHAFGVYRFVPSYS